MGLKSRREILWKFIEEHLEVGYGYLPKSNYMDDKDDSRVDEYIQEVKDDIKGMVENGWIKEDAMDSLKKLDEI